MPQSGLNFILPREMPSQGEVIQILQNRSAQKKALEAQQQQQAAARMNALNIYAGENLQAKNYDDALQQQVLGLKTKYAQIIQQSGGAISTSDLATMMQADLQRLTGWNQKFKQGREQIELEVDDYKDMKGVNRGVLKNWALKNFMQKRDENGNWVDKDFEELDPNQPWVTKSLEENPMFFVDGEDKPLTFKPAEIFTEEKSYEYTGSRGQKSKRKYVMGYNRDYQEVKFDKDGKPTVVPKGEAVIDDETGKPLTDSKGAPIMMAPVNVYKTFMSDKERRLNLLAKFQKENGRMPKVNDPDDETLLRTYIYQKIPVGPLGENRDVAMDKEAPVTKIYNNSGGSGKEKEVKLSPVDYLLGRMNGAPTVATMFPKKSNGKVDLLSGVGGWKFISNGKGKNLTSMEFDESNPYNGVTITWEDEVEVDGEVVKRPSKPTTYTIPEFRDFLRRSWNANSSSQDMSKMEEVINGWFDKDGNLKNIPPPPKPGSANRYRFLNMFKTKK